jgi:hypothetical protein
LFLKSYAKPAVLQFDERQGSTDGVASPLKAADYDPNDSAYLSAGSI